jgi:hypothetical protein
MGCTCHAYYSGECACDADWTPQEIYDLREIISVLLFACKNVRLMIDAGLTRMDKDGIEMLDAAIKAAVPTEGETK